MNDLIRRMASGACMVVVALLPIHLSAQDFAASPPPAIPANGWRSMSNQPWHYRHASPSNLTFLYRGWYAPFAGLATSGLTASPVFDGTAALNRGGFPVNSDLMAGSGNGNGNGNRGSNNGNGNIGSNNGNGNSGSNNGNGNSTDGNGNYINGNGVGNGNSY